MTTQSVECWNCGQVLSIRADKLETARCGSCQQMIVRQEQPEIKTEYRATAREPQGINRTPWIVSFIKNLVIYVGGAFAGLFLLYLVFAMFGLFWGVIVCVVVLPALKFVFVDIIGGAAKETNKDRD